MKINRTVPNIPGGAIIETSLVKVDRIKIGPHTLRNKYIRFMPYEGSVTDFDGLLGMDIIGGFSYTIDFAKKVIVWK